MKVVRGLPDTNQLLGIQHVRLSRDSSVSDKYVTLPTFLETPLRSIPGTLFDLMVR